MSLNFVSRCFVVIRVYKCISKPYFCIRCGASRVRNLILLCTEIEGPCELNVKVQTILIFRVRVVLVPN